jgi:hypothetical protein
MPSSWATILGLSRPAELDGFLAAKKVWTILPRHHVGDIGKQLTMEQQQLFTLKATTEPDDALATLKSSQHFGELQTMEKRTIYFGFRRERWNTLSLSDSMATGSFAGLHGNPLLRAWRQPSTVRFSIVRHRIGAWDTAEEL